MQYTQYEQSVSCVCELDLLDDINIRASRDGDGDEFNDSDAANEVETSSVGDLSDDSPGTCV